ncbi:MAG: hypothetical protein QNJ68_07865 [Microcoleaceae cyanobacterium MO_207.B10]|nr:hypothetical protein [Microcoleaceae cyanobacterium MO_207.B10]
MTINLTKSNQLYLEKFIKLLKPISIGCAGLAISSLAIYPLINNKSVEVVEEKVTEKSRALPPAAYTIIMGEKNNEVVLKFHNQNSELHLKNISNEEYNCLLGGGGVNCVLAETYQPKLEVVETETRPTTQTEVKQQSWKIPDIEISREMIDNIVFIGGVGLGLLLLSKFKKQ